jgi:chemotaxis protein MotB
VTAKPPIIVIKKRVAHGGHHGGAWKVAYADFVTAMMALFIVLWLMNSSKKIQQAVGGYFKDPSGTARKIGSDMQGAGENFAVTKDNMEQLKDELQKTIRKVPDFDKIKNHIDMTITSEGLRIELLESATSTFFGSGNAKPNEDGQEILDLLAQQLGSLPNKIAVEGHTDSKPYAKEGNYGNWELSADRANATRRLMQEHGIRVDQIMQVRGFADQRLRKPDAPLDASNRRVSLIVQYLKKDDSAESDSGKSEGAENPAEGEPAK